MTTAKKPSTGATKTARPKTGQTPRTAPQKAAQSRPALPSPLHLTTAYAMVTSQDEVDTYNALALAQEKGCPKDAVWFLAGQPLTLNDLIAQGERFFVEALIAFAGTQEVRSRAREWAG